MAFELNENAMVDDNVEPIAAAGKVQGLRVDCGYRLDVIVDHRVLVELKAIDRLLPIHEAQVVTYLRLAQLPVGLLVNFNVLVLKNGLRRLTPQAS